MTRMHRQLSAALLLALPITTVHAQDWSQWRGPHRDGVASTFAAPEVWPEQQTRIWSVPAGLGHSSPLVSGDRVYLLSRVDDRETVTAYDLKTGRQIWRDAYDAPYDMNPAARSHGKGPKSTPVLDRGRLFTLGISGVVSALEAATGKVVWRHDFRTEFAETSPDFGAAMSPIVDGDNVIAHVGGIGVGAIVAFDRTNGSRKWSWSGDGPAYASPVIGTFDGVRHLVTQTHSHVVGIAPEDGRELWRIKFTTNYSQNSVTPVVAGGLLIYSGLAKGTTAVRPVLANGAWHVEQVWQNADVPMYMSSPVEAGGVLYGLTHLNRGQFFAVELTTGKTLWTSPPRQAENAALTAAGDVVIATTTNGELLVIRRGQGAFDLVRKYEIAGSPVWAHHAHSDRGVLIKDAETLAYWTFQPAASDATPAR